MSIFNLYVIYIICKSWISHDSVGLNQKKKINKAIAVLKYKLCTFFLFFSYFLADAIQAITAGENWYSKE